MCSVVDCGQKNQEGSPKLLKNEVLFDKLTEPRRSVKNLRMSIKKRTMVST